MIRACDRTARKRPIHKLDDVTLMNAYVTRPTALHVAAYMGALPAANLLLERGAGVNSTASPKDMTPLHLAAIGEGDLGVNLCGEELEDRGGNGCQRAIETAGRAYPGLEPGNGDEDARSGS